MDLLKKELILLRNGYIRIFRCKTRSFSTRKLLQNYTVQDRRGVNFCRNEQLLNLKYITTFDVIRRFLCNTKTNFDASNDESLPGAVKTFQEYLQRELDAMKLRLEQVKKWAGILSVFRREFFIRGGASFLEKTFFEPQIPIEKSS